MIMLVVQQLDKLETNKKVNKSQPLQYNKEGNHSQVPRIAKFNRGKGQQLAKPNSHPKP